MSTIVKAVRELEAGTAGSPTPLPPTGPEDDEERRRRRRVFTLGICVLAASVGVMSLIVRQEGGSNAGSPRERVAPTSAPLQPTAPVPARQRPRTVPEPPRGQVATRPLPPVPPHHTSSGLAATPSPVPPPVALPPRATVRAADAPVRVLAIAYSPVNARSTVSISLDGGTPVTLRQGENVNGLEVQLITPESVYLRQGGNVFALDVNG
jgi:hypothetical protein